MLNAAAAILGRLRHLNACIVSRNWHIGYHAADELDALMSTSKAPALTYVDFATKRRLRDVSYTVSVQFTVEVEHWGKVSARALLGPVS